MPVAIAAVGIGVLVVVLRRPTVAGPPDASPSAQPESKPPAKPLGTIILRDRTSRSTVRLLDDPKLSTREILDLAQGKGLDNLTQDLLKLMPNAATSAIPEAQLAYPDSMIVLTANEVTSGTSGESRGVYKTTFATNADGGQVVTWYQDWLTAHGWQPSVADAASPAGAHEYVRGDEHFRLALADPAAVRSVIAVPIPDSAKTIFEVEYRNTAV